MRHQGKIIDWNDARGFGFIAPIEGGQPVFVHISSFAKQDKRPIEKALVSYELTPDAKGRLQARKVAFVVARRPPAAGPKYSNIPLVVAGTFFLFVTAAVLTDKLPVPILMLYLFASGIAFCFYALDKSAAQNGAWRIPEGHLHLCALLGGWPGALAAQRLLRHKTRKQSFRFFFLVTVIVNCGVLAWLFTPAGAEKLQAFLPGFH